ncbi:hypothetical protein Hanom_Chr08g00738041 [Helianthus anomalus]
MLYEYYLYIDFIIGILIFFYNVQILSKDSLQTIEPCHHFISTPYRPQETPADQQQAIPSERNEYQIYSYALQDDVTFNQLGYIFDSRKGKDDDDYSCYEITTLFKQAIEQNMTWAKVKCGYCVMLVMYDFVICNREHMLVNKTRMVRQGEIDEFVERTLKVFIPSFGDVEDKKDQ